MKHPSDELARLISGDLREPRASAVRAHVRECAHCQAAYDRLEAVEVRLRALPRLAPPPDFMLHLQARIAQAPPAPVRSRPWAPLGAFFIGVLALALSFGDLQRLFNAALPSWTDLNGWWALLQQSSADISVTLAVGMCALAVGCVLLVRSFAVTLPPPHASNARDRALA